MTHGSLFSGIGGAELAALWMGWENVFHCEINPFGRKVLDYYFNDSKSYEDITKTDFKEWRGKIDVLTGGFPCQPFSQAGKRNGDTDDRYLWPQMLRAISEIRPTWVVGENVAGITSMVESCEDVEMGRGSNLFEESIIYRKEQQFTIERICKDFEHEGYSVQPVIIPACAVGAPHRRDRVWFIANTDSVGGDRRGTESNRENKDPKVGADLHSKIKRHGNERAVTNTNGKRLQSNRDESKSSNSIINTECIRRNEVQLHNGQFKKTSQKECRKKQFIRTDCSQDRWRNFPTESPICCRNDGLSAKLDGITFPKWRAESIKAYGNAWVPQVAYEIFKAIEVISENM